MVEADKPFIYSSWLKALRYGNPFFQLIDQDVYFQCYKKVINKILEHAEVNIAVLEEEYDVILGWCAFNADTVHFVFVKRVWRGHGIAKSIMPVTPKVATHFTKIGQGIMTKKGILFNPFIL